MGPIYYVRKSGDILNFTFEVESVANKTQRVVWNFQNALGWIGGLLSVMLTVQMAIMSPFVADAKVYQVANLTISGKTAGTDTQNFYLKQTL